jgi:GR25 family glycosyltransferase involved in LPS biosynthesis
MAPIVHDSVVKVYLINLDSRPDRLSVAQTQLSSHDIKFERIPAVSYLKLSEGNHAFVTPAIAAIWLSHMKAIDAFLASGSEYALVLEDDFIFKRSSLKLLHRNLHVGMDFLQLGFLTESILDSGIILLNNFKSSFFQGIARAATSWPVYNAGLLTKIRIREQIGSPRETVPCDIQAGAHAYVISREFAAAVTQMNDPIVFSTDAFFMTLGKMRTFNMRRLKRSCISQSNSSSSVNFRFRAFSN